MWGVQCRIVVECRHEKRTDPKYHAMTFVALCEISTSIKKPLGQGTRFVSGIIKASNDMIIYLNRCLAVGVKMMLIMMMQQIIQGGVIRSIQVGTADQRRLVILRIAGCVGPYHKNVAGRGSVGNEYIALRRSRVG